MFNRMVSKRFVLAALTLVGIAGMVFAGGGSQGKAAPSSNGKETLVIGIQSNAFVTDYKDNYLTRRMENLHNVNLDFYILPADNAEFRTKVSLMVASNDLPDIIFGRLTEDQILDYGSKGALIPLNKYINDPAKSPYFNAIRDADKNVLLNTMTSADSNIYGVPMYEGSPWNLSPYRYYINQAWLTKLGLKLPATTDELRNALIAFRDRDPNGNGRKDEIGLYGLFSGGYGENIIAAILNSFIFYNPNNLALDKSGNTVIAPFIDPAFRKGLIYLNTLYKDGVLAASTFTDDQQQFRANLNNNPPVVGITSAGSYSHWPNANENANFKELKLIPPLAGPDGVRYTPYTPYEGEMIGYISSKSKNPDLAFKLMDSFYSLENSMISRFGEEDVDWSQKPEVLAPLHNNYVDMGVFPKITFANLGTNTWSSPNNKIWLGVNNRYFALEYNGGNGNPNYVAGLPTSNLNGEHYQMYLDKHPAYILPTLKYSPADAFALSGPITDVNNYVKQSIAEFTVGTRDINNDAVWNAYIRELNGMGLPQWLNIAQTTYNRQKR